MQNEFVRKTMKSMQLKESEENSENIRPNQLIFLLLIEIFYFRPWCTEISLAEDHPIVRLLQHIISKAERA